MSNKTRREARIARHRRVRSKVFGSTEKPRLAVKRSLRHISAQVIDDSVGRTLVAISTTSKKFENNGSSGIDIEAAKKAGKMMGDSMKEAGITSVVFDRGGHIYHGRIRAFADGAREAGIKF